MPPCASANFPSVGESLLRQPTLPAPALAPALPAAIRLPSAPGAPSLVTLRSRLCPLWLSNAQQRAAPVEQLSPPLLFLLSRLRSLPAPPPFPHGVVPLPPSLLFEPLPPSLLSLLSPPRSEAAPLPSPAPSPLPSPAPSRADPPLTPASELYALLRLWLPAIWRGRAVHFPPDPCPSPPVRTEAEQRRLDIHFSPYSPPVAAVVPDPSGRTVPWDLPTDIPAKWKQQLGEFLRSVEYPRWDAVERQNREYWMQRNAVDHWRSVARAARGPDFGEGWDVDFFEMLYDGGAGELMPYLREQQERSRVKQRQLRRRKAKGKAPLSLPTQTRAAGQAGAPPPDTDLSPHDSPCGFAGAVEDWFDDDSEVVDGF